MCAPESSSSPLVWSGESPARSESPKAERFGRLQATGQDEVSPDRLRDRTRSLRPAGCWTGQDGTGQDRTGSLLPAGCGTIWSFPRQAAGQDEEPPPGRLLDRTGQDGKPTPDRMKFPPTGCGTGRKLPPDRMNLQARRRPPDRMGLQHEKAPQATGRPAVGGLGSLVYVRTPPCLRGPHPVKTWTPNPTFPVYKTVHLDVTSSYRDITFSMDYGNLRIATSKQGVIGINHADCPNVECLRCH